MSDEPVTHIVDDDAGVREGLRFLMSAVGLAAETYVSADALLASLSTARVGSGCIVTDVRMPGLSGLELQTRLREQLITLPVIVVTGHADIRMAVRAMKAGAFDFIEKPFNEQELLDMVRLAIRDNRRSADFRRRQDKALRGFQLLTPRERQVLALIMDGEPNKQAAFHLGISEKTVEFHRANIMAKIGARSSTDLVRTIATMPLSPRDFPGATVV